VPRLSLYRTYRLGIRRVQCADHPKSAPLNSQIIEETVNCNFIANIVSNDKKFWLNLHLREILNGAINEKFFCPRLN